MRLLDLLSERLLPCLAMARPKKAKPIPPAVLEWLRQEGARGGRMGAAARWKDVPAAVRSEGARKAARARWAKAKRRKAT